MNDTEPVPMAPTCTCGGDVIGHVHPRERQRDLPADLPTEETN